MDSCPLLSTAHNYGQIIWIFGQFIHQQQWWTEHNIIIMFISHNLELWCSPSSRSMLAVSSTSSCFSVYQVTWSNKLDMNMIRMRHNNIYVLINIYRSIEIMSRPESLLDIGHGQNTQIYSCFIIIGRRKLTLSNEKWLFSFYPLGLVTEQWSVLAWHKIWILFCISLLKIIFSMDYTFELE